MNNTGISLCMIVRNEEEFISASLERVRQFVQEIIVVDTGSTDRTPDLVLAGGGKLLNFAWEDDFAQARNFSLRQAHSPWILVLDADEMLEPAGSDYLFSLLRDESAEGYFVNIVNIGEDGRELSRDRVVRLFRNRPEYVFEGTIHEQVAPSIRRHAGEHALRSSGLTLKHLGYSGRIIFGKDKIFRNKRIIRKQLDRDGNDKFMHYCLGLEYYQEGDINAGLAHLRKALGLMSGTEGYFTDILCAIGSGYLKLGEWGGLWKFADQALAMLPRVPDLLVLRGLAGLGLEKNEEAFRDLLSGLNSGEVTVLPAAKLFSLLGDLAALRKVSPARPEGFSALPDGPPPRPEITALFTEGPSAAGGSPEAMEFYLAGLKADPGDLYPLCKIIGLWQKAAAIFALDRVSRFVSAQNMLILYGQLKSREDQSRPLAPLILLFCVYQSIVSGVNAKPGEMEISNLLGELLEDLERRTLPGDREGVRKSLQVLLAKDLKISGEILGKVLTPGVIDYRKRAQTLITDLLLLLIQHLSFAPETISSGE